MTTSNGSPAPMISPLAYISPDANIGREVTISPFCYIDKNVEIGDGTWIGPNVTIFEGARIGKGCRIYPGAVISAIPQDLKFAGEYTTTEIGDNTVIRECVTINRGTQAAWKTTVGDNCLIMAYVHIAHDCKVGNNVILVNNTGLSGHVEIEDYAVLEGNVGVQQFIKIGAHSFIAGGTLVRKNVPPYAKAAREPIAYISVNTTGLTRRGFSQEVANHIKQIYNHIFVWNISVNKGVEDVLKNIEDSPYRQQILNFIKNSPKGIIKGGVKGNDADSYQQDGE